MSNIGGVSEALESLASVLTPSTTDCATESIASEEGIIYHTLTECNYLSMTYLRIQTVYYSNMKSFYQWSMLRIPIYVTVYGHFRNYRFHICSKSCIGYNNCTIVVN